jgi:hypothetical protein
MCADTQNRSKPLAAGLDRVADRPGESGVEVWQAAGKHALERRIDRFASCRERFTCAFRP